MNIFNNIGLGIATVGTVIAGWFGYVPVENQVRFGASTQSSEVRALFTTTLASKITSSATSMTLSSATDKDGTVLASSTYGFIIDEGTSKEELVLADCTGTTCTNMTRGLSVRTGTTTVAALQFEHGRGAEVKITDAPALIYASNVFRGKQNIEYKLKYDSTQTFSDGNDIISRSYADSLAFGAIPEANETTSGFVEIATAVEVASTTSSGTVARLAIPASLATSTYNSATAGLKVVVTQNDGKIDNNFLPSVVSQQAPVGSITAYASTTAPTGWLLADGTAVSRTTYSALFAIIGTSYGVGDSSTTFNLPNLTGRSIVMASSTQVATSSSDGTPNVRSTIGSTGGETKHTQTEIELATHYHSVDGSGSSSTGGSGIGSFYTGSGVITDTTSKGSAVPMNVLDPYIVLNYIIKY